MAARIRLLLVALLALAASSVAAQQGTYTIDVPSGQWKAVHVRNVPEGALLAIVVKVEGQIGVSSWETVAGQSSGS